LSAADVPLPSSPEERNFVDVGREPVFFYSK